MGRQVEAYLGGIGAAIEPGVAPSIKDSQFRALAMTSGKRDPGFPDVPTLTEAGVPDQSSSYPGGDGASRGAERGR